MGIGVSLFLLAVGAVLTWAVDVQTEGIDLNVVGVVLMVVALVGLALSGLFWSNFSPYRRRTVARQPGVREVVEVEEVPRTRVVEEREIL